MRDVQRGGVVRVERLDPAGPQGARDPRIEPVRERRVARCLRRDALPVRDLAQELGVALEDVEDLAETRPRGEPNVRSHDSGRYGTLVRSSNRPFAGAEPRQLTKRHFVNIERGWGAG